MAIALLAACAPAGAPPGVPADPVQPREWRFAVSGFVALWYHGLAHTGTPAGAAARMLPLYDPEYAARTALTIRQRGEGPTPVQSAADEFAASFRRADSYARLELLPLYFDDQPSLDSAVRVWTQVGGDPRRAGSPDAANAVALLSGLFPQPRQQEVLAAWQRLLAEERHAYHDAMWRDAQPRLDALAAAAAVEWAALEEPLRPLLDHLAAPGGVVFLVPALADEGRLLLRGAGRPRMAIGAGGLPIDAAAADDGGAVGAEAGRLVVYRFLRELVTPLAGEAVHEYLAPARIRQIGDTLIEQRAAVRATALALDAVSAEHGPAFRRAYVARAGVAPPAPGLAALERAFRQAFPLPVELERGLATAMRDALAGI